VGLALAYIFLYDSHFERNDKADDSNSFEEKAGS
jgi:hypothetical protein